MVPPLQQNVALFLDVDETLVDFQLAPAVTRIDDALRDAIERTWARLDGALALISGRPIEQLDRCVGWKLFMLLDGGIGEFLQHFKHIAALIALVFVDGHSILTKRLRTPKIQAILRTISVPFIRMASPSLAEGAVSGTTSASSSGSPAGSDSWTAVEGVTPVSWIAFPLGE